MDSLLPFLFLPVLSFPLGAFLNHVVAKRAMVVQPDVPTWPENFTWAFSNGVWMPTSPPLIGHQEVAAAAIARSDIPIKSQLLEQQSGNINTLFDLFLLAVFLFSVVLPFLRWLYHIAGAFDSELIEAFGFMEDLDAMHDHNQESSLPPPIGSNKQTQITYDDRQGVSNSKNNAADNASKQLVQLRAQVAAHRKQNDDAIALILARLDLCDVQFKDLQNAHQQLGAAHKALQQSHSTLVVDHTNLEQLHDTLKRDHDSLESNYSRLQQDFDDLQETLWEKNDDLQQALEQLGESDKEIRKGYDDLRKDHDTLREDHTKLGQNHSDLAKDFDDLKLTYDVDKEVASRLDNDIAFSPSTPSDSTDLALAIAGESDADIELSPSVVSQTESPTETSEESASSTAAPTSPSPSTSAVQGLASKTLPAQQPRAPTRGSVSPPSPTQPSHQTTTPTPESSNSPTQTQFGPSQAPATTGSSQDAPSTQPGPSSTPSTSSMMTPKIAKQLHREGRFSEIDWCGHEMKGEKCKVHTKGRCYYRHSGQ